MTEEYKQEEDLSGMEVSGKDIQSEISSSYDELLSEDSDLYKSPIAIRASSNLVKQRIMDKFKLKPKKAMEEIKSFLSKQDIKESYLDNLILDTAEEVDLSKSHYKAQYKEVFKEYPLGLFRKHLKDNHTDLAREPVPDKKNEKIQKIVAESNAIIRAFGYLIGFKRMKAKSNKNSDYGKAWEEREDLRELLFGRIMMPMMESIKPSLKREVSEKQDLLKQDIKAVEQPMEQVAQGQASNNFRIGAVIDVEKLGINTELLRQVLTGQARGDRRLAQPGGGGAEIESVSSGISEPTRSQVAERIDSVAGSLTSSERTPSVYLGPTDTSIGRFTEPSIEGSLNIDTMFDRAMMGQELIEGQNAMQIIRESASQITVNQVTDIAGGDLTPFQKLQSLADLEDSLQNRLNAQAMTTGESSPATVQLKKDKKALKKYNELLQRYFNLVMPSVPGGSSKGGQSVEPGSIVYPESSGSSQPAVVPVVRPSGDSQDSSVPTEDAKNIKKESKRTFEPSRRRVVQQAQQLVLKSVRPKQRSRLMNPVSEPDQVNYYAPSYRHRYRGGLRVIQ
jgi:hypothetical protein